MKKDIRSCVTLIRSHLQLADEQLEDLKNADQLELALTQVIQHMLNHDFNRLLNAFYKIDLNESVFKEILATAPPSEMASLLARQVIKREMMKVKTRQQYRN